jgi:hypothetical protein
VERFVTRGKLAACLARSFANYDRKVSKVRRASVSPHSTVKLPFAPAPIRALLPKRSGIAFEVAGEAKVPFATSVPDRHSSAHSMLTGSQVAPKADACSCSGRCRRIRG